MNALRAALQPLRTEPETTVGRYLAYLRRLAHACREVTARRIPTDGTVRLICDDQLVDIASIGLSVIRDAGAPGTWLVEYICPHCDRLHASPLREARR